MMPETLLRMQNKKAEGLGVPLPSGQAAVFEPVGGHEMLVGEGAMRDHAVGEKVDLVIGERSEEHTSELQSLMRISYAVFCLKKKTNKQQPSLNGCLNITPLTDSHKSQTR